MRWVEILEIRSFGNKKALMVQDLPTLLKDYVVEKGLENIEIYCHGELSSDWSIHLHYCSEAAPANRSIFGLRLVSMLKESGFVHHSIWNEMRRCELTDGQ